MKKFFLVLALFLAISMQSIGQELTNYTPVSPEAAGLGKYGDIPVSNYTGLPNINIPLYEISSSDLSLPISLSYHASGIRVNEDASWVGLGWSLNAGGVITRIVRGKDDFGVKGFYYEYQSMPDDPSVTMQAYFYERSDAINNGVFDPFHFYLPKNSVQTDFYNAMAYDDKDWSSDLYTFNFAGVSGKFVFDNNGLPQLLNHMDLKIEYENFGSKWKITTANGTKYSFETHEKGAVEGDLPQTSSWFLTKIESANGNEINFLYSSNGENDKVYTTPSFFRQEIEGSLNCYGDDPEMEDPKISYSYVNKVYLEAITFTNGFVEFERDITTTRADLLGGRRLKNIKIYQGLYTNPQAKLIKEYEFQNNQYFLGVAGGNYASELNSSIVDYSSIDFKKRLKLTGVIEKNPLGDDKPPYLFEYNSTLLPSRISYAIDHWGYFNGASNSGLIPPTIWDPTLSGSSCSWDVEFLTGANREVSEFYAKAAVLEKIIYPTGGYTSFEYESNVYENVDSQLQENVIEDLTISKFPGSGSNVTVDGTVIQIINSAQHILSKDIELPSACGTLSVAFTMPVIETAYIPQNEYPYVLITGPNNYQKLINYQDNDYLVNIDNHGNNTYTYEFEYTGKEQLSQGTYHIIFHFFYDSTSFGKTRISSNIKVNEVLEVTFPSKFGGGLRTKKTITYDPISARQKINVFEYFEGELKNKPKYERPWVCRYIEGLCNGYPCFQFEENNLIRYSNSITPLSNSASGSYVGYDRVNVLSGNNAEYGKTEFTYHNAIDFEDSEDEGWRLPGIPSTSDPRNGNLLIKKEYVNSEGNFELVSETVNKYPILAGNIQDRKDIWGIQLDYHTNADGSKQFDFHQYKTITFWNKLLESTQRLYNQTDPSKFIETKTVYNYDNNSRHHQVIDRTTINSDGKTTKTYTIYPEDLKTATTLQDDSPIKGGTLGTAFTAADRLKKDDLYQIATPIQVETIVKDGATVLSETIMRTNFSEPYTDIVVPNGILEVKGAYNAITNPLETKIEFLSYYANGKVKELKKTEGITIVYLWGYNEQYPIAKIENATFSDIPTSIYNSILSKSDLDDSEADENTLRAELDKLRNTYYCPNLSAAMVTTYTYDPLVGVTSITDPKGYTTYYEYDAFNRLEYVRDASNNVLSKNEYHYKGQ